MESESKIIRLESLHSKLYPSEIYTGLLWMVVSAACSGLGNGLQTISPLAHLHIFTLLIAFEYLILGFGKSLFGHFCTFCTTVIIQSIGSVLGFAGAVTQDEDTGQALGYALSVGLVQWFLLTFFALYLHYAFMSKFPKSILIPLVFPAAHTAVTMIVIGFSAGTFTALGGAVLDYAPLRYVAVLFGLGGVHFTVVIAGTYAALCFMRYKKIPIQQMAVMSLCVLLLLLTCGAFLLQSGWFYQQGVSRHVTDTLPVSCVLGQEAAYGGVSYNQILNTTADRARAGDSIILMSETAFKITNSADEQSLLSGFSAIAAGTPDSSAPFIGVTYSLTEDGGDTYTNRFALFTPDGSLAWNYRKSYPNPMTEYNVRPGQTDIPTTDAGGLLGKLGGAIGFDLDHPLYIHQAGLRAVDVMLQPVWTWQSMGPRHFDNNALRAIENGFTLFRCSSDGVSGVISGRGAWGSVTSSQTITGHDTAKPALFQLPVGVRKLPKADGVLDRTFYVICGFAFDWIMLGFSVVVGVLTLFPFKEHEYRSVPVLQHSLTAPNGCWSEFSFFPAVDRSYQFGFVSSNSINERREKDRWVTPEVEMRSRTSGSALFSDNDYSNGLDSGARPPERYPSNRSSSSKKRPKGPSFSSDMRRSNSQT